ncbi:MAG: hypothetical protein ACI4F1_12190 [Bariatricus sp.]
MKMTKHNRVIAFVTVIAMLSTFILSLSPDVSAAEETETIYIDTVEDFKELAEHCTLDTWSKGKTVVLQEDISLANVEEASIPIFDGVFDGNGHTISGLKLTESMSPSGLFGVLLEHAVVKNLYVSGAEISSETGENVGGLAGENYGTITGCEFTGHVEGDRNVGGIVGINASSGHVEGCSISGSVIGDRMTGGIAGCNLGEIRDCTNNAYINTTSVDPAIHPEDLDIDFSMDTTKLSSMDTTMASSDTGGIAGYSSGILLSCVNQAPVGYPHIGYNIGGIAGRSCGYVEGCENTSAVYGRKDVGGISGQMEPYIAQNITESTLAKLERQFDELDALMSVAMNDANDGVGNITSRLNRIADYADSAAGAAKNIRTSGTITSSVNGNGSSGSSGSVSVSPSQAEAEGSSAAAGGGGAVVTPGGGVSGGAVVSGGEITAGVSGGSAEGSGQSSASGNISASTQISVTTSLSGLSSAIYGMSGQMRLLNGEVSGTSGTLTEDLKAIQEKINQISDTAMELFRGDGEGDILVDSSEIDIDLVTLGKSVDCQNSGSVNGDINVGGIAGSMAMEYELDPEDDISANLDSTESRKLEVKAIIQKCVNTGEVISKRSYAGSICGKMDLGLISNSEGYGNVTSENGDYVGGIAGLTSSVIRRCFAKCTLSGKKNIGGIVGSGVTKDLSGDSSTVAGCYSMVNIESYKDYVGAVSGVNAGIFVENYFVSDTLTGINGRSYTGKAQPITYEELLNQNTTIPEAFSKLSITFTADDEVVKKVPFTYGESFDESIYPSIPEKDGYYGFWDKDELTELHLDTVVKAVYTPYVTSLSNGETRNDGRPVFFIEGQFDDEADAVVTTRPNTPSEFDNLAKDWNEFLKKSFRGMKVGREIVEQWKISIPDDGEDTHTIRYLAPDTDPDNLEIYVKDPDDWKTVDTETIGSYLAFEVQSQDVEVAVIRTVNVWWVWLIAALLVFGVLLLFVKLILKIVNAVKGRKQKTASEDEDEEEEIEEESEENEEEEQEGAVKTKKQSEKKKAKKKKKKWPIVLLVVLALLLGISGTTAFFLLPDLMTGMKAYELLKEYSEQKDLNMKLDVKAKIDSKKMNFSAEIFRTEVEGNKVTAISQGEQTLYYCDGIVLLENGTAYEVGETFPDYSNLLSQAITLYQHVEIREKDGAYTITAEDDDARAILELLMPSVSDILSDTYSIEVKLVEADDEASKLSFSGSGVLNDSEKTSFDVSAELDLQPEHSDKVQIPEAVRKAIVGGEIETSGTITEDGIRMANAWATLNEEEFVRAALLLKADCGPLTLNDTLDYYRWNCEGTKISSIQKNGFAFYLTDEKICNQNGDTLMENEVSGADAAKLLDLAYQICLNAEFTCSEDNGEYIYSVSLDQKGMKAVAYAIASEAEGMDITFDSGSIQIVIRNDKIKSIVISTGGNVQVLVAGADVAFEAKIDFKEESDPVELPETVKNTLVK